VRSLLQGKPWLDRAGRGEGWFLLARALEEDRAWAQAADAYARYLRVAPAGGRNSQRVVAELRRGLALLRTGQAEEGTAALERVRGHDPAISGWAATLVAEALEGRGDTARIRALVAAPGTGGSPARMRTAHVRAYLAAKDPRGARAAALAYRARAADADARAELGLLAGRAALQARDTASARADLRAVVTGTPEAGSAAAAARLLESLGRLSPDDRLMLARVYDRHGDNARAASGYSAWLAAGRGAAASRQEVRYRMGQALFDLGRYPQAETALRPLHAAAGPYAADAMYLAGRAQSRRGSSRQAQATFLSVAQRFRGTRAAANALYLAGDLSQDAGADAQAQALYRRVASEHPGSTRAGLALMRLSVAAYARRDYAGALRTWEEMRRMFPSGDFGLQATYWSGRALLARGDSAGAAARFREVRTREPVSYYAVQSASRLRVPAWPVPLAPAPRDAAATTRRVEASMHALDLLRAAGLYSDAAVEARRLVASAGDDRTLLYPLAEALSERGYTSQGIAIGRKLQGTAARWNARTLKLVYPFPYSEMVAAEARERGLDPFLVAAQIRQESSFEARATSGVGARGLMQLMPETGRQLAPAAQIRSWDPELLYTPEINVHMGVRYLADQMHAYGGSLPSVFAAYNAGPQRVERWRRFPEYRDAELFTERIPYDETRDYVKILTRNVAIYRGLYGK